MQNDTGIRIRLVAAIKAARYAIANFHADSLLDYVIKREVNNLPLDISQYDTLVELADLGLISSDADKKLSRSLWRNLTKEYNLFTKSSSRSQTHSMTS